MQAAEPPARQASARLQAPAALPSDGTAIETPGAMAAAGAAAGDARALGSAAGGGPSPAGDSAARQVASLPVGVGARAACRRQAGGASAGEGAGQGARSSGLVGGGPGAPRRAEGAGQAMPELQNTAGGALPRGERSAPAMPAAGSAEVDAATLADVSPSDGPTGGELAAAESGAPAGRMAAAGLPVRIAAPVGPGGLSSQPGRKLGLPSRRARAESEVVHTAASRMILERSGSKVAADVRVRDTAVPGLRQRDRAMHRQLAQQRGGSEASERAVEMGLDFLARHQNPDGSWSLHDFSQGRPGYENAGVARMQSNTAATGLSMLAFLGAGYTHTDGKYRLVVGRGLGYLLGNQRADGDLFVPQDARSNLNVWLYSHGIASIALGEAYGMTRDPSLQDPASALDFIVAAQNPSEGGWRYSPGRGSDTSVSGWQLMARQERRTGWTAGAAADVPARAGLARRRPGPNQPGPVRLPTEGDAGPSASSQPRDDGRGLVDAAVPGLEAGQRHDGRRRRLPARPLAAMDGQRRRARRLLLVLRHAVHVPDGRHHWRQWNDRLRPLLIDNQQTAGPLAGSWDPLGPHPDRWGREAGRIYVTAMHLLMLEVYYRHLPLYRNLEGEGAELQ